MDRLPQTSISQTEPWFCVYYVLKVGGVIVYQSDLRELTGDLQSSNNRFTKGCGI